MASPSLSGAPQAASKRVGYEVLRECHKRAYAYLTEALKIDEGGVGKAFLVPCLVVVHPLPSSFLLLTGDKSAAIDYYSKGVTELEKGISYTIHGKGYIIL